MKIPFRNIEVFFSVSGQGPVVVWLHGFLESIEIWENQKSFFNSKFTNIYIDLLGHGKTGCIGECHSMELQAAAVHAVVDHLNVDRFLVVGHSMGGYIGLALLERLGSRITHFVLLNSTSYSDTAERQTNRERAIKIIANQKDSFVRMGIVNLFSEANRKRFSEAIIDKAQKMSNQGITAALKGMKNRSSRISILKNYQGNKLIVSGKEDPIISIKTSEKESKLTNSEILQLKGGHMSYLEDYSEYSRGLMSFLLK